MDHNHTSFIKIYHSVWDQRLEPGAFRAYCAILRFMNSSTGYANVNFSKLAAAVSMSERSLRDKVGQLEAKGLIRVTKKYYQGHRLANGYIVSRQYGGFTKVPVSALNTPVTAFGFKLYAYLLKCSDLKGKAFPSLRNIRDFIGATMQTVITQISELVELGLIKKRTVIKKNNAYGHNQYKVRAKVSAALLLHLKKGKEKTRCAGVSLQSVYVTKCYEKTIHPVLDFVKGLLLALFYFCSSKNALATFLLSGTLILAEHALDPYKGYTRERKNAYYPKYNYIP
ncbi:helix-turn-helix domain-containing protein [Oscillospiraceae bacterium MB08-C2-2]|nr:helix-turn-helix domain-containing protein [Oscillospiraceae bacterium MB08-C2-2]